MAARWKPSSSIFCWGAKRAWCSKTSERSESRTYFIDAQAQFLLPLRFGLKGQSNSPIRSPSGHLADAERIEQFLSARHICLLMILSLMRGKDTLGTYSFSRAELSNGILRMTGDLIEFPLA
jgi:hypothetical protein